MKRILSFGGRFVVLAVLGMGAGCVAHAQASGSAAAEAPVVFEERPTLVAIDSGVWVVRDSARAVYYVDDNYWVYREGTWYRAQSYDSGWTVVEVAVVPGVIVHRTHKLFVHYHGDAVAQTRPAPRAGEVTLTEAREPRGTPPGHDDTPGVGNQRKADGEQPGRPSHADATTKGDPPGVGNARKAEGVQPGKVGQAGTDTKTEKKDEKKTDKKVEKKDEAKEAKK